MIRALVIIILLSGLTFVLVGLYCALILASRWDDKMEQMEDRHHDRH